MYLHTLESIGPFVNAYQEQLSYFPCGKLSEKLIFFTLITNVIPTPASNTEIILKIRQNDWKVNSLSCVPYIICT